MFHWLEKNPFFFAVAVFVVIAFAGLVEILPNFAQASRPMVGTTPYSTLELTGRLVYIKNNCNGCHSQLIRPFKSETDRYGHYSMSGEYAYDRPFLWGSKRTGPDLLREGGKYNDNWHFNHFWNPQSISAGSIMPGYKWLFDNEAMDNSSIQKKMEVMVTLGVPYTDAQIASAPNDLRTQALKIEESLKSDPDFVKSYDNSKKKAEARGEKFVPMNEREIVALIAYIQRLGTDIKVKNNQ